MCLQPNAFGGSGRLERTSLELTELRESLKSWIETQRQRDPRQQFASQIDALDHLLLTAVADLELHLETEVAPQVHQPSIFALCSRLDRRALWLRQVWDFFRDKLEQRDSERHEAIARLLSAADEVVWSCYHAVMNRAVASHGPPPLPFVDARYSPSAIPRQLVPHDLKGIDAEFLRDYLNKLPIPVLRIPEFCVRSPWWLVFVAHEVGHHIQYELAEARALIGKFRDLIKSVVSQSDKLTDADAVKWGQWSEEIFADAFSIVTIGPHAVWAMVEFELDEYAKMTRRRKDYPPPIIRLALLAETWKQWSGQPDPDYGNLLRGLDPKAMTRGTEAEADFEVVTAVAKACLSKLPIVNKSLDELSPCKPGDFLAGGNVESWSARLLDPHQPVPSAKLLQSASIAAAATVSAWKSISGDDARRSSLRESFAARALQSISLCQPPGKRSSKATQTDLLPSLGQLLLQTEPEE